MWFQSCAPVITYEILQEAMEQGLRMNSWEQRLDEEKMWTKSEWMNECNYRLKKIVIVINDTSRRYLDGHNTPDLNH